jgi:hypothetical protein
MPNIKAGNFFDTQMEHSHPIINPNVPKTHTHTHFHWALYDNNIFDLCKSI